MNKNCFVVYTLENGTKLYVSNINMKSYEYKEIHLTDNKVFAKQFDEFTAKNIVLNQKTKVVL